MVMTGNRIADRYRIVAPLGEGGMATICRAVDEQLGREVAVKLLREQFGTDSRFAARFRAEARAAAALNHPNIVNVFDYGTDAGTQYIVMQLVDGQDLSTVLRRHGPLPIDDAVHVAIQVAAALEAAHRRGIVHRDVKPGNILVDEDGDVKVTDFGIARAVAEASITVTGTTLGSVHYFSPEQARGDEVTGASDVYSLGIVLYEMVTGRRPFEGDSAAGVALRRLNEDPKPPSTHRPIPRGLEAIILRALARDPQRRYADGGAFAEALRSWRRDPSAGPVPAAVVAPAGAPTVYVPPPVTAPPLRPPVRGPGYAGAPPARPAARRERQPWWIWLLLLLAILLLATIGFLAAQIISGLGPRSSPSPAAEMVTVPNWIGDPITQVRVEAEDLGLELDEEPESSDVVQEGDVIRTDPGAGTQVREGSTVVAYVSKGRETVEVPRLLGQTLEQAERTLEAAELRLGNISRMPSDQPQDTVISTNPSAGTTVDVGSPVDLVISTGPTPSPEPTPEPTPVPTPVPTPTPTETPPSG
jgi:hypothetical protein